MSTKNKPGIHLYQTMVKKKVGARYQVKVEYYWHIVASNGRIIARSSETYSSKAGAAKSIKVAYDILFSEGMYYDHSKKDSTLQSYL